MKKLILILASLAVLIALGLTTLAVIYRYENYQDEQRLKQQQEEVRQNQRLQTVKSSVETEVTDLKSQFNTLREECTKGMAAYNLLTAANQKKVAAPVCGDAK